MGTKKLRIYADSLYEKKVKKENFTHYVHLTYFVHYFFSVTRFIYIEVLLHTVELLYQTFFCLYLAFFIRFSRIPIIQSNLIEQFD